MRSPLIILASASSRRRALLEACRIPFRVEVSDASEEVDPALAASFEDVVAILARRKAEAVRQRLRAAGAPGFAETWILAADTIVAADGVGLGKPRDTAEARGMLERLSGKTHRVHTGIALVPGLGAQAETEVATTSVCFRILSESDLEWYLSTREWEGAAGGYRIQERAGFLVQSIQGSYSNVVGLPLEAFYGMLVRHHYKFGGT